MTKEEKKQNLLGSTAVRTAAFILCVLMTWIFVACVIEAAVMIDEQFYDVSRDEFLSFFVDSHVVDPVTGAYSFEDNLMARLMGLIYDVRYAIYPVGLAALIIAVVCFVYLMSAAGHRKGSPGVAESFRERLSIRIPFDLLLAGYILILACGGWLFDNFMRYWYGWEVVMLCVIATILFVLLLFLCMNLAVRVKLGKWWVNTILWRILKGIWWLLKKAGSGIRGFFRWLPVTWRTVGGFALMSLFMLFIGLLEESLSLLVFWALVNLTIGPLVTYCAVLLRKLQAGAKALAEGDLDHQIDTRGMFWDFRQSAVYLNNIAQGMTIAVEQRTKSDRMKTELITNVSHDIKTPLTSIINYSDLIGREPSDNPKITEYADVLNRQSTRLKKLVDDLVEASKASSGNLEVNLAPFDVNVFLDQAAAEYKKRFDDAGLQLVCHLSEEPLNIMADGRRMQRVMDNLVGNACKYAMPGTRVYLDAESAGTSAVISIKNVSREALNIPADELMARFVRGDASRSTEGSGLGLSISKSLAELQKGQLQISVDGDLFKAELIFDKI